MNAVYLCAHKSEVRSQKEEEGGVMQADGDLSEFMDLGWDLQDCADKGQSLQVGQGMDLLCLSKKNARQKRSCSVGIEEEVMTTIERFRLKPRPSAGDIDHLRRVLLEFKYTFQEQKKWQSLCTLVIEQCHMQHEKVMELLMSGMRSPSCNEEFEEEKMEIIRGLAADDSSPLVIDAKSTECFREICKMRRELLGMWTAEDDMHTRIGEVMKEVELIHTKLNVALRDRSMDDSRNLRDVVQRLELSGMMLGASESRVAELDIQNTMMLQQAVDMNLLVTKQQEQISGLKECCSCQSDSCLCSSDKYRKGLGEAVKQRIDEYVELQSIKRQRLLLD